MSKTNFHFYILHSTVLYFTLLCSTFYIALKHSTYVNINRPIQEVWDFFSDINNMGMWLDGFQRSEHLSGELGKAGSTYKQYHIGPGGQEVVFEEEVLESVEGKRFSSIMKSNMMEMQVTTKLYPKGDGTELISEVEATFTNMVFRLFQPIIKKEVCNRQDNNFKKLKAVLEGKL